MERLCEHGIACSRPLPALDGGTCCLTHLPSTSASTCGLEAEQTALPAAAATAAAGRYAVRCFTYLPGRPLSSVQLTDHLVSSWGELLGRVSAALRGFDPPPLRRATNAWQYATAGATIRGLLPQAVSFSDQQRSSLQAATAALDVIALSLDAGRWQVCHADGNEGNLIVDDAGMEVTGLVDFGDMCWTWLPAEVAIALAYAMLLAVGTQPPLPVGARLLAAYQRHVPLSGEELAALPVLVRTRVALSLTLGAVAAAKDPGNADYLLTSAKTGWLLLGCLESAGDAAVAEQLLRC